MSHIGISGAPASGEYSLQQVGLGEQQQQYLNPCLQMHNQQGQYLQQLNSLHTPSGQMRTGIGGSGAYNERTMLDDDIKGYEEEIQKSQHNKWEGM